MNRDKESNKINDYFKFDHQFILNNGGYGTFKTRSIIHTINTNPDRSFIYFAPRHDLLQEVSEQLSVEHAIWKGWSCKCKDKNGRERLINAGVPATVICQKCQYESNCPYFDQFKTRTNILLPTSYVNYPAKLRTVSADVYFFDELISSWEILSDQGIQVNECIDQIITRMHQTNDNEELFNFAKELKQIQYLEAKFELRTHESIIYYPRLYRIFRLLRQKKKVVITDANLSRDEFETLLKRYPDRNKLPAPYWIPLVKDRDFNLRVCCPFPEQSFYKNYFYKNMNQYHAYIMRLILDLKRKGHKLCVVTFKDWKWAFYSWQLKTDVFHFDANAGSNQFRDYDTIVVVGTYLENPKVAADYHAYLTGELVEINTWEDYKKLPKETRNLFQNRELAKNLEAVFRIRPNDQQEKIVIYFGRVPEMLKENGNFMSGLGRIEMELGVDKGTNDKVDFGLLMDIAYALETSKNVTEAERKLGWSGPKKRNALKSMWAVLKT